MSLYCCTCFCGSADSLVRGFLKNTGYRDWLSIPIAKGKEASRSMIEGLPRSEELRMLSDYIASQSKWAVIIGVNDLGCRWSDLAYNNPKARIEAELLVETFA